MLHFAPEITSMAEACLGGLHGRSALLIGPERLQRPYTVLLQHTGIKAIYQEETPQRLTALLPMVQLLMHIPDPLPAVDAGATPPITAAAIARGCAGRRAPLVIFDLAETSSIEELAGLLPAVCLYTPDDLRAILARYQMQIA
jgi:glutamyl-tRNA reductase